MKKANCNTCEKANTCPAMMITKKAKKKSKKLYVPRKSLQQLRGEAVRNRIIRYVQNNPNCKIVVSTSGGKDSAALKKWAVDQFGAERIEAVHAYIDLDWHETLPTVEKQCQELGIKLTVVERDDKASILDLLLRGQMSAVKDEFGKSIKKAGKVVREWVQKKWAGTSTQWCTSQAKIVPLDKYCKSLGDNVLVLIGERADESNRRARKHVWHVEAQKSGKKLVKCSPLYDYTLEQIWEMHEGVTRHPIYALGHTRASCAICIYSRDTEIALAARHAPDIVARYLVAEKQVKHSFRPDGRTIATILREQGMDPEAIIAAHINDPKVAKYNVESTKENAIKFFGLTLPKAA